ncbi:MAG: hypothetical protein JWM88_1660 [Verrucomicrobia bacterium]|nr:hypothetical protein [Verrucomicrobiota bacterium]
MDLSLILAAQTFQLAPDLQRSEPINGIEMVKNPATRTFLRVTLPQWQILQSFVQPKSVPAVLAQALEGRYCLALEEFYELILKAVRAQILITPGETFPLPALSRWRVGFQPRFILRPFSIVLLLGLAAVFYFQPSPPSAVMDVVAGVLVVSASLSVASVLSACVVHGAGAEIFPAPWQWWRLPPHLSIDTSDAVMLPMPAQQAVGIAEPAVLAAAAGLLAWRKPEWNFIPLVALAISLRPIFGGKIAPLVRFNRSVMLSDAEHSFLFPPSHRPKKRWEMLKRAIRHPDTWARLAYGIVWTLGLIFLGGRLADSPPWTMDFWRENGHRVAFSVWGSLAALGLGYLAWEIFFFVRQHFRSRRNLLRLHHRRWIGAKKLELTAAHRADAVAKSPLFRTLTQAERDQLAAQMEVSRHRARTDLPDYGPAPARIGLIVSGRVGLFRKNPEGRFVRAQVLSEGDVVGLHDAADPQRPEYFARTITPVTLFTMERAAADELAIRRIPRNVLTNTVLKLPFLRQIPLCRNWHFQAVERFAALSHLNDIPSGGVIFPENQFNQDFFVIFENRAEVSRNARRVAVINAGDFFGEIGLLQNSPSTAQVSGLEATRCLSIDRSEFLRFVTHNYTVALELERVSSKRLGYPIFPLRKTR